MTDPQHEETFADTERKLREIITTLRAQLAEARAELSALCDPLVVHMNMLNGRIAKPSVDGIVHIYAGQITRADRAEQLVANLEAALAAQIEVDAGIACGKCGASRAAWLKCSHIICLGGDVFGNQPHDRTALDRMLAEASEKALREAGEILDDEGWLGMSKHRILALIEVKP